MFWQNITTKLYVLSFIFIIGLGVAFYFILGREADSTITEQLLRRQLTLARAQSSNIVSFFNTYGDSIAVFSRLSSMHDRDEDMVSDMNNFIDQWKDTGLIGGISLTDEEGTIEFNYNISGIPDVGSSVTDRDYYQWAKAQTEENGYYIGTPVVSRLGVTKGEQIIPVASPIIENGIFEGVLVSSVRTKTLTEKYLEFMRISDQAEIFLISSDGRLIYNNFNSEILGNNIFETVDKNPFLGSEIIKEKIKNVLDKKDEGSLKTSFLSSRNGNLMDYYLAYTPVTLKNHDFILVIATPVEVSTEIITPLRSRLTVMFILVAITLILYGFSIHKTVKQTKDNGQVDQNKL